MKKFFPVAAGCDAAAALSECWPEYKYEDAVYLASDVDARIAELEKCGNGANCCAQAARIEELERLLDVERRAVAAAQEQAGKAERWEAEANRLGERVAELEKALRWHVSTSHDKFCDVQDGKSKCNCGFDLLNHDL